MLGALRSVQSPKTPTMGFPKICNTPKKMFRCPTRHSNSFRCRQNSIFAASWTPALQNVPSPRHDSQSSSRSPCCDMICSVCLHSIGQIFCLWLWQGKLFALEQHIDTHTQNLGVGEHNEHTTKIFTQKKNLFFVIPAYRLLFCVRSNLNVNGTKIAPKIK